MAFNECDRIAESHPGIDLGCTEMLLVAIIVDPTALVYSFEAPADRRRLLALSLQQIQCRTSGFVQSP